MNKNKFLTFLVSFLLVGCQASPVSSTTSSMDLTLSSNSSESVTSQFKHQDSNWKGQLGDDIIESFGVDIPSLGYGELMDYDISVDSFNDTTIFIYWSIGDDEDFSGALDRYYSICSLDEWECTSALKREFSGSTYYEYTVYYADKVISEDTGIEIQFLEGAKNGVECLGFYIFSYPYYDPSKWPTSVVNKIIDEDIPHTFIGDDYTYTATLYNNDSGNVCEILVDGTSYGDEEDYLDLLKLCDFDCSDVQYDEDYGFEYYYAYSPDFTYCLQFFYDTIQNYCLTIYIYPITSSSL